MRTADPGPLRLFALLAGLGYFALSGGWLDTLLVLIFSAWQNRHAVTDLLEEHVDAETRQHAVYTLPGAALALLVLALIRFGGSFLEEEDGTKAKFTTPMRPLLIPAKTTHRRTFPEKHDFAYSYLVVGIPVGWTGNYGGMVSSGIDKRSWSSWLVSWFSLLSPPSKGWFDIDPADYLERGNGHLGLRGKLDAYLTSQVRRVTQLLRTA